MPYNELMSSRLSQAFCSLVTQLSNLKEENKEIEPVRVSIPSHTFVADPALLNIPEHSDAFAALLNHLSTTSL